MEEKKAYIIPEVTSYTAEEILTELGETHAFAPPPVSPFGP